MILHLETVAATFSVPLLVFRADTALPLPQLLSVLSVHRSISGGRYPANLLYTDTTMRPPNHVRVVGILDAAFEVNHEFALCSNEPELLLKAHDTAEFLYELETRHSRYGGMQSL